MYVSAWFYKFITVWFFLNITFHPIYIIFHPHHKAVQADLSFSLTSNLQILLIILVLKIFHVNSTYFSSTATHSPIKCWKRVSRDSPVSNFIKDFWSLELFVSVSITSCLCKICLKDDFFFFSFFFNVCYWTATNVSRHILREGLSQNFFICRFPAEPVRPSETQMNLWFVALSL